MVKNNCRKEDIVIDFNIEAIENIEDLDFVYAQCGLIFRGGLPQSLN